MKYPSLIIFSGIFALLEVAASTFSNTTGNGDFTAPENWESGEFPKEDENAVVNKTGANRAILNSFVENKPRSLQVGLNGSGELEILVNGLLQTTNASGNCIVGHNNGDLGLVEQNGGTICVGASVQIGTDGGDGTWNLNAGMLKTSRGSFDLGGGSGSGTFKISGGALQTRAGVNLSHGGNFIVNTSSPHWIELGSTSDTDGYWDQASGSTATFFLDHWGTTPIEVKYVDGIGRGGEVVFEDGAQIKVGFADGVKPINGTWTVITWDGPVTNNGLSFSPEVDTSVWSFAIVNGSLKITAFDSSLNNTTNAGTPHDWYDSYFNGLGSAADYEALELLDSDGDGLANRNEFLKKTDPTDTGIISSLEDLMKYASCDGVNIKMVPGEYVVTRDDILNLRYEVHPDKYGTFPFLRFIGNNSNYDLTGVTIKISAYKYAYCGFAGGSQPLTGIHVIGDNNVIRGLVWEENDDNYSEMMFRSAVSIIVDGDSTRLDSIEFTTAGSYPYGYGSYFGIGAERTINHNKHSGLLLRGNDNHLFKVTYHARTFGHGLFIQGAQNTTFEECYVEGVLRTTDDMLTETSGPAYDIGFVTRNGDEVLQPGYMAALHEDGIRAYSSGLDYETGETKSTDNVTVINCTIKNMRRGVHLSFTPGGNIVRETTVIGVQEVGFLPGDNDQLINCYGDATYCPVLYMYYSSINDVVADITVIEREESDFYGHDVIAYIAGSNNQVTIRDLKQCGGDAFGKIHISGESGAYFLPGKTDISASNNTLMNESRYPIFVGDSSNGAEITTSTAVTDQGSGTDITTIEYPTSDDCSVSFDAFSLTQAEDYVETMGGRLLSGGEAVTGMGERDWLMYPNVDFGNMEPVAFEILLGKSQDSGGDVELRLDSPTGEVLTRIATLPTGGSRNWQSFIGALSRTDISGVHTLFITIDRSTSGTVVNIDAFRFIAPPLQEWRFANFGSYDNEGSAADDFDADFDRLPNFLEYATGLNPNDPSDSRALKIGESLTNPHELEVSFNRVEDPTLTYILQGSDTLLEDDWEPIWSGIGTSAALVTTPQSAWPNNTKYFFRLKVNN